MANGNSYYLDIINNLLREKAELEKNSKVLFYKSLELDCYFFGPKGNIGKTYADNEHYHPSYPDILQEQREVISQQLLAIKEDEVVRRYIEILNELAKYIHIYAEDKDKGTTPRQK